ncbi:MAG: CPBP family intramembrane glutamic endopeptidase [Woeseia sp.]
MPVSTEVPQIRFGRLLALVLLAQVCALFLRSWLEIELDFRGIANATHLSYLVVPPVLLALLLPLLREHKATVLERLNFQQLTWKLIGTGLLLGVLLRISNWCALIILGVVQLPTTDAPIFNEMPITGFQCPPVSALLSLVTIFAMLTPVVEEALNRGLILHWLLVRGRRVAIVLSAFFFAIFHAPEDIPFAFGFGLFAAVYVLNSGNLWGAIIAHGTFNGLNALDWLCFRIVWQPSGQSTTLVLIAAFALAIGIATTVTSFRIVRKRTTEQ